MSSKSLQISDELKVTLLKKLDALHDEEQTQQQAVLANGQVHDGAESSNGSSAVQESKSQLVLRHVLESGKFSTEKEVEDALNEYMKGRPLAYITGLHTFGSLSLVIRPPVYIPRVETEQWVLLLVKKLLSCIPPSRNLRILDICSGSGCIPLLLAKEGNGRIETVGLEVDERALSVARENAKLNGIETLSTFEQIDLFSEDVQDVLPEKLGKFDLVVSNPPYVSAKDMKELAGKWFEGNYALQGKLNGGGEFDSHDEDDGLSFYRRIKQVYSGFLACPAGPVPEAGAMESEERSQIPKLVLEVGATQSKPVQEMYESEGRAEVYRETARRMSIGAPNLEKGNMVGTERSLWIYGR